jgi:hypothetical protein
MLSDLAMFRLRCKFLFLLFIAGVRGVTLPERSWSYACNTVPGEAVERRTRWPQRKRLPEETLPLKLLLDPLLDLR